MEFPDVFGYAFEELFCVDIDAAGLDAALGVGFDVASFRAKCSLDGKREIL